MAKYLLFVLSRLLQGECFQPLDLCERQQTMFHNHFSNGIHTDTGMDKGQACQSANLNKDSY